jgi:hypothetical protein
MYNYTKIKPITNNSKQNNSIFIIGSILRYCGNNNIIFGAGLKASNENLELKDNKVYCVRGKLTSTKIDIKHNILMIDPGLLIRKLYTPKKNIVTKKMLIIPHYNHSSLFTKNTNEYDVLNISFSDKNYKNIINSENYSPDKRVEIFNLFNKIFDIINSYDLVLSSSLHGIVLAHAFGKKTV